MFEQWPNENAFITNPWLNSFIFSLIIMWPVIRICRRLGLPSYYALPTLIPMVGWIITAGLIAHTPWPALSAPIKPKKSSTKKRNPKKSTPSKKVKK